MFKWQITGWRTRDGERKTANIRYHSMQPTVGIYAVAIANVERKRVQ